MIYGPRFDRAVGLACELHRRQVRKAGEVPYIAHLLAVTALVAEAGGTEDEAIAAVLHDAAEDQGGQATLDRIRREFGEAPADIVAECSDSLADTAVAEKAPWRDRKEAYLAHLDHASPSALLVSCADKLHNLRSLLAALDLDGPAVWSRFKGGPDGTKWYYREALARFERRGAAPYLLHALRPLVADLQAR